MFVGFVVLLGLILLGGLAWWLFFETEGVYLGRGVVTGLYDIYARRYDRIKSYDPHWEYLLLARPIMAISGRRKDPLILDIATGTARLPVALCGDSEFDGQIVGIDLSRKMLSEAADKLAEDLARVDLIHVPAECLPFPDNTFDMVTYLEALEFMRNPEATLRDAFRVLRPGGVMLTTRRINIMTMPGKIWTEAKMTAVLEAIGAERITYERWQETYQKVWLRKPGTSNWAGKQPLEGFLCCPVCGTPDFRYTPPTFICRTCKARITVGVDGVIEFGRC